MPFVEVTLSRRRGGQALGWDTHAQNFETRQEAQRGARRRLVDADGRPQERGLLDSTLIVWMGEFGRTPKINANAGRDHFPAAWTTVLAGGGIKGGQAIGRTSDDGTTVEDRPVSVPDFIATVCHGAGHRPEEAEPLERRPADPDRRPRRQADRGGPRMNRRVPSLLLALFVAVLGRAPAGWPPGLPRNCPRTSSPPAGRRVQDVIFLADARPLFVRFHIRVGGDGFRTAWADFAGASIASSTPTTTAS